MKSLKLSVLLLALTASVPGQQSKPSPENETTFKSEIQFVQVPVIVQKSGKHLTGLTKDDFVLLQDGKQQPLVTFEEIHSGGGVALKAKEGTFGNSYKGEQSAPQIIILAVDTVNTPTLDQAYFREELKKYLSDRRPEDPPMGLVELTRSGLRIIHDFTRDANALAAGIDSIQAHASKNNDTSGVLAKTNNEQQQRNEGLADQNPDMDARLAALSEYEDKMVKFQDATARIDSLLAIQQMAQTFKGIPGRKTLIWAGSGFPFMNISTTNTSGQRSLSPDRAGSTLDQHVYTWKLLNDANIAVYPIDTRRTTNTAYDVMDPSNKYSPSYQQKEAARDTDSQTTATFQAVAQQTGGKPCIGRTDLKNCIREALEDNRDYYMLGFYVDKNNAGLGWHKVQVKVDQKAAVRYREGFMVAKSQPDASRAADLTLALNSPFSYTSLPFSGRFKKVEQPTGHDVDFELRIPPDSITLSGSKIDFDIVAVVRAAGGKEAARISQHIAQSLPPQGVATIQTQGINYTNKLEVPPGDYGVWFVLRDNLTGRTGSVTVPLKVQ